MDHATLTDNTGRKADFRNVVLILTSNAGSREMSAKAIGFAEGAAGDDRRRRAAACRGRQVEGGDRTRLQPGVPQPARRHRHVQEPHARRDGDHRREVRAAARSAARRAARRDHAARRTRAPGWRRRATTPSSAPGRSARVIQREVRDPLTDEILFGKLENGGTVTIGVDDGSSDVRLRADRLETVSLMTELKVTDRRWWARGDEAPAPPKSPGSSRRTSRNSKRGSRRRTPSCSNFSPSTAAPRTNSIRRARGFARRCRRTSSAAGGRSS